MFSFQATNLFKANDETMNLKSVSIAMTKTTNYKNNDITAIHDTKIGASQQNYSAG